MRAPISEFYKENVRLIHSVANKAYPRFVAVGSPVEYDDLVAELSEVFLHSYRLHDESKSKFGTYFTNAAYNKINNMLKRYNEERIEHGVRSVEELAFEDEDGSNYLESVPSEAMSPDEILEGRQELEAVMQKMSLESQSMLDWLIQPPSWLVQEYEKVIAFNQMLRLQGEQTRQAPEITISFVAKTLIKLGVMTNTEAQRARKEISHYVRHAE